MGSHNARNTDVMGSRLFFSSFLNIPQLFAGFVLLGICLSAIYCTTYDVFKRMKEEPGLLIQLKKIRMQQGLNL